ncbi:hypothetical protein T484DRAFT_1798480, partial [Baffinella frigidus]
AALAAAITGVILTGASRLLAALAAGVVGLVLTGATRLLVAPAKGEERRGGWALPLGVGALGAAAVFAVLVKGGGQGLL